MEVAGSNPAVVTDEWKPYERNGKPSREEGKDLDERLSGFSGQKTHSGREDWI